MEQGGVSREAEGSEEEALADDGEARAMKKSKKKLVREQTLPLTIQWSVSVCWSNVSIFNGFVSS